MDGAGSRAGSDPAMFAVPSERARNAVIERDLRRVADLTSRTRDVEGAALGVEVHSPPVQRRLQPEWRADCLAGGTREPERPNRQMQPRRAHAGDVRDPRDQL